MTQPINGGRRTLEAPCECSRHPAGAPWMIGEHSYELDAREVRVPALGLITEWRWSCSCRASARTWQMQSPSVSYHMWLNHVQNKISREDFRRATVPARTKGRRRQR